VATSDRHKQAVNTHRGRPGECGDVYVVYAIKVKHVHWLVDLEAHDVFVLSKVHGLAQLSKLPTLLPSRMSKEHMVTRPDVHLPEACKAEHHLISQPCGSHLFVWRSSGWAKSVWQPANLLSKMNILQPSLRDDSE